MNRNSSCMFSETFTTRNATYVGLTADVRRRLDWHNVGQSPHTSKLKPWTLVVALEFSSQQLATAFEKYLKTGSGRAFAKRHFS